MQTAICSLLKSIGCANSFLQLSKWELLPLRPLVFQSTWSNLSTDEATLGLLFAILRQLRYQSGWGARQCNMWTICMAVFVIGPLFGPITLLHSDLSLLVALNSTSRQDEWVAVWHAMFIAWATTWPVYTLNHVMGTAPACSCHAGYAWALLCHDMARGTPSGRLTQAGRMNHPVLLSE